MRSGWRPPGTAPTYDAAGSTAADNGQAFAYDAWHRLVAARTIATGAVAASYAYDALGRRVAETYPGTTAVVNHLYYSADSRAIEERRGGTAAANLSYQYVWGEDGSLVLRDAYSGGSSARLYALQDANGDVAATVDASGVVQERYAYDPYGAATVLDASGTPVAGNASASAWRYLFQAGRLDAATGMYIFGARDYIPAEGRWMQRDPLGLAAGDLNEYRFVGNSPVDETDPTGLDFGASAIIALAFAAGGYFFFSGSNTANAPLTTPGGGTERTVKDTSNQIVTGLPGVSQAMALGQMGSNGDPGPTGGRPGKRGPSPTPGPPGGTPQPPVIPGGTPRPPAAKPPGKPPACPPNPKNCFVAGTLIAMVEDRPADPAAETAVLSIEQDNAEDHLVGWSDQLANLACIVLGTGIGIVTARRDGRGRRGGRLVGRRPDGPNDGHDAGLDPEGPVVDD